MIQNEIHNQSLLLVSEESLKQAFWTWYQELEAERIAKEQDSMIDEATVMARLHKSRSTLWRWAESGYLPCTKVGGKNMYKLSDINKCNLQILNQQFSEK